MKNRRKTIIECNIKIIFNLSVSVSGSWNRRCNEMHSIGAAIRSLLGASCIAWHTCAASVFTCCLPTFNLIFLFSLSVLNRIQSRSFHKLVAVAAVPLSCFIRFFCHYSQFTIQYFRCAISKHIGNFRWCDFVHFAFSPASSFSFPCFSPHMQCVAVQYLLLHNCHARMLCLQQADIIEAWRAECTARRPHGAAHNRTKPWQIEDKYERHFSAESR